MELESLKRQVYRLQLELDILQKAAEVVKKDRGIDLQKMTNREKTMVIDALREKYPLNELLALVAISKSTYFYQKKALSRPDKYASLRKEVRDAFGKSKCVYGYRRIHAALRALRPDWEEKVKVVMTGGNQDPEEWQRIIGNAAYRKELARRFKDDEDPFKIAIVVDMWLTGFDVPSLATMYVYKPMAGHNLMQAIARVNRVFEDKEGGLVVDYIGIATALKEAMKDYTRRDKKNFGEMDIRKTAYPKFQEKLQVCKELLHGFDLSPFTKRDASAKQRADAIRDGANFVFGFGEDMQKLFIQEATYMRQFKSLCQSLLTELEYKR